MPYITQPLPLSLIEIAESKKILKSRIEEIRKLSIYLYTFYLSNCNVSMDECISNAIEFIKKLDKAIAEIYE